MRCHKAHSTIAARPEAVWAVLCDRTAWASWDSGVDQVEGRIEAGQKIKIHSKVAPGRSFPVRVTVFEPPGRLQFSGGMPLGLFRGVRTYDVAPATDGGTAFHVREEYTGPRLGLMWRSMPDLGPSFAQGLRGRVESAV